MSSRWIFAVIVLVATVFFVSGLRYVPGTLYARSGGICGPLTDSAGNVVGDAGPCPSSFAPLPTDQDSRWEWAPFWVAAD